LATFLRAGPELIDADAGIAILVFGVPFFALRTELLRAIPGSIICTGAGIASIFCVLRLPWSADFAAAGMIDHTHALSRTIKGTILPFRAELGRRTIRDCAIVRRAIHAVITIFGVGTRLRACFLGASQTPSFHADTGIAAIVGVHHRTRLTQGANPLLIADFPFFTIRMIFTSFGAIHQGTSPLTIFSAGAGIAAIVCVLGLSRVTFGCAILRVMGAKSLARTFIDAALVVLVTFLPITHRDIADVHGATKPIVTVTIVCAKIRAGLLGAR